jgi:radical SAM/Cys-rich protein
MSDLKETKTAKKTKLKSLLSRRSHLSVASEQIAFLDQPVAGVMKFNKALTDHSLPLLKPKALEILQINLGYMCNLTCEHCHVDAGPDRKEIMEKSTLELLLALVDKEKITCVDLTGGAPEMHPDFIWFVSELSKRNVRTLVRSNLTILVANKTYRKLPQFFKENKVEIVASLPCYTQENVDKQRGDGVFNKSIEAIKILNEIGYGVEGSGLILNLVFNPGGAGLPGNQQALEADYKRILGKDWGITFNFLFTITNLPVSRFLDFLIASKRYEEYMLKLVNAFNPAAVDGVMCKNTLSIDWQGFIYDCDFNQMLNLKIAHKKQHIKDFDIAEANDRSIIVGQHCFACTAGAGSSCQGALV